MANKRKEIPLSRKDFIANYPHFRYWKNNSVASLLQPEPLNIYLHIPFCAQKCSYCYYKTEGYRNPAQLQRYIEGLCKEMKLVSRQFNLQKRPVKSIYIGGGTPSLLNDDMLGQILASLKEHFQIDEPEFTLEAEPRTINEKKLATLKKFGVTRMSIGVQSFNDEIIKKSGRNHSAQKALDAVKLIKEHSDITINIDLLSGLAGETMETWKGSVDTAIAAGVHNITVYKMEVYLNTEFFSQSVRKKLIELPSEEQELEFMKAAIEKFKAANYKPWSFFTFTRDGGFHHQYASNLWKGEDCCAMGSSAFGLLGKYNYQNANEVDAYLGMVDEKKIPIIRAYEMTNKDIMLRDILLGMKLAEMNRSDFVAKHGFDFCELIPGTIEELVEKEFIQLDEHKIALAPKGILYGDYVGKRLAYSLKNHLGDDKLNLY